VWSGFGVSVDTQVTKEVNSMSRRSLDFILGILCLGGGLFLVGQAVSVSSVWGAGFHFGGISMPSGLVIVPLLIGIGMLFYNHKGRLWKYVTGLGVVFILLAVILSVRITVNRISLFEFVIMFGFTVAGIAMLLRFWFFDESQKKQ